MATVLTDGNWRFKRCCCCSNKIGTTILGILFLLRGLSNIVFVCLITNDDDKSNDNSVMLAMREVLPPINEATRSIFGVISAAYMVVALLLIYGNCNNNAKLMTPAVYTWLVDMILGMIIDIIAVSKLVDTGEIIITTIGIFVGVAISLLLLQVIRSRIADIDEERNQLKEQYISKKP